MKIQFEVWLENSRVSSYAMELFSESIKSYKASAYKAGLLYSYLGFMTVVKERIIQAGSPPGITPGDWAGIQSRVMNVEQWDASVYDAIQKQQPATVFPITDTIRREIVYWKDRRNDCAHFKHSRIDYHHVESLWQFIESNLGKFAVNGGSAALLKKFKDHFDPSITKPGSSFTYLIGEIAFSIESAELPAFYASVSDEFNDLFDETQYEIFNHILSYYHNHIADALVTYLKEDQDRLIYFLREHPDRMVLLDLDPVIVRRLWHKELFSSFHDDYPLYAGLIQNKLLVQGDYEEAHVTILRRDSARSKPPNPYQSEVLEKTSFYQFVKNAIFPSSYKGYAYGNASGNMIIHYLNKYPVDAEIIRSLSNSFHQSYPPKFTIAKLGRFLEEHPEKVVEFKAVIKTEDLKISQELSELLP